MDATTGFESWAAKYVRQGRVIDWQQEGVSHSEGQAWGLLLAQVAGDRDCFEEIESWTAANLAVRQDRLMGWRRWPEIGEVECHTATDGDLFRAWALLRADRDQGWTGHLDTAIAIARDIADLCLVPDPRFGDQLLISPGTKARRGPERVLMNPSYVMPRALRELGEAAGDPRLTRAADHGEAVLLELVEAARMWDWIDVTTESFAEALEHRAGWGFDALRVPLYLAWSERRDHPAVSAGLSMMEDDAQCGHVVVRRSGRGLVEKESDHPGFLAIPDVVRCQPLSAASVNSSSYYADTLRMLAAVAQYEGGCALPS
ncbi:glycosyl hydrolase family 8 [Paracoccus sp. TK19116]|uniref:cellulase n=1 Tax=Paracoccus albicereus TaxID=2922394 RepID=A0ABT1MQS0_9RHOB|nr:glycosyl hydrolase family 8 [Paracoccus albicereus]MCQ0970479.1 glycosyl hydrolase family 8 [Paracoccus albicereus]